MSGTPPHSVCSTLYQLSLRDHALFELRSFIGRRFMNRMPRFAGDGERFLNLGCGVSRFEGWTNADFFPDCRPWKRHSLEWMLDLRYPLNCDDETWDGIFSEHTLEHLYPDRALALLKELRRTMKTGAWLRVTVPDLRKYVSCYVGGGSGEGFGQWPTGCEAIRSLTQNWGHLSVWDAPLLGRFLEDAGFLAVKEVGFGEGADARLLKDSPERCWETLYMEARKGA